MAEEENYCEIPFNLRMFACGKMEADEECQTADDGESCLHLQISRERVIITHVKGG